MRSNFQKVQEFNERFGNTGGDPATPEWERLEQQADLIHEEVDELREALAEKDFTAVRDAIADILVTTYGLAHRLGVNADADFQAAHKSNMTKFCASYEAVIQSANHYLRDGVQTDIRPHPETGTYALISLTNQRGYNNKYYPKGKLLKPLTFQEPEFNHVV